MRMAPMTSLGNKRRQGFSIIELLIAIIIIGVLVTILIPVIANRTEDARLARARQDIESLADAQDRMYVDVGYFGVLSLLNNVVGGDGVYNLTDNTVDVTDGIRDIPDGISVFIDDQTQDYVPAGVSISLINNFRVSETTYGWNGPYVNWQRDANFPLSGGGVGPDGIPDDPWGRNYLLFTRLGLVVEDTMRSNPTQTTGQVVEWTTDAGALRHFELEPPYYCKLLFDRPTIISLGRDGLPGDHTDRTFGRGDDIIRKFGR